MHVKKCLLSGLIAIFFGLVVHGENGELEAQDVNEVLTSVVRTGTLTDLAVQGEGFFILRDPVSEEIYATRRGDFRLDELGRLVSIEGFYLQGFNEAILAPDDVYPDDAQIGDIQIDNTMPSGLPRSNAGITNAAVDESGRLRVTLQDGTQYTRGRILLQHFGKPEDLVHRWPNLFASLKNGQPLPRPGRPGEGKLGSIVAGALDSTLFPENSSENSVRILVDPIRQENRVLLKEAAIYSQVQSSTDLAHWTPVYTNRYWVQPISFREELDSSGSLRFYRVVVPEVRRTGIWSDIAILGEGYFVLRDADSGELFATRSGRFHVDTRDFLISEDGLRLQGYNTSIASGNEYSSRDRIGDLKVDDGTVPNGLASTARDSDIETVAIDGQGRVKISLTDGSEYVRGQVLLQNPGDPFSLEKVRDGLHRITDASEPIPTPAKPDSVDRSQARVIRYGRITSGALEFLPKGELEPRT